MSLITISKISLAFAGRQIFHDIGFQVEPGDRIGIVGPNGSGKTTLLRLLTGDILPDSGEVRTAKGARIGYLPQDAYETIEAPVLQSVIESVPGRVGLENELERVRQSLKHVNQEQEQEQTKIGKRLAEIHHDLNQLEYEFPRFEAEKILMGLGFETADFQKPIHSLSGGWKTRAALAALLYQKPDLLLLDEPTNHLDIPSIQWLEQFLQDCKGAIILVSHDREFLNRQIRRTISLEPEGMKSYSGNYDFYLKTREEEKISLEATTRRQDQKVKEAQRFIERFRAKATKARQAQSKIKLLKKLELVEAPRKEKITSFSFPEVPRSGSDVVTIKAISKSFGEKVLYKDLDLNVQRRERIAIIGPNGCGKTTLLRMVAREIEPDGGEILPGHGVSMSFFAQHHSEMLHPQNTIIQEVYKVVPHESIGFVRGVCGAFLFSGEDVDKRTGILSGGERARVSLAKLLVKPGNFMVMDEPTNHLDISSSEALIDALEGYNGTLLFVSHNKSFINRLATKIWDIKDGHVEEYPGNLDEYDHHLAVSQVAQQGTENEFESDQDEKLSDRIKPNRKAIKRERAQKRQEIDKVLKPMIAKLQQLEDQIAELESRQKDIEEVLVDPDFFKDTDKSVPLLNEYSEVRQKLEKFIVEWEQSHTQLESAKNDLGL